MINLTGQTNGVTVFNLPFERSAGTFVNTTQSHDCCEFLTSADGQEFFTPVTTADSLEIVSTSANDVAAGTGTKTVGILYLDANGNWSEFTATMNGTTPVAVGIQASAIISIYAKTGGSSLYSAGAIVLRKVGTTTIYDQITANSNHSQSGRFTCPRGYYAVLIDLHVSVQGHPIEIKLRTTRSPFDGSTLERYSIKSNMKLSSGSTVSFPLGKVRLDAGQALRISGITDATAGSPRIHGVLDMELIKL